MDTANRPDQEVVYVPNPFTGQTEVRVATEDRPSPESQRLAEALAVLADPDAEVPQSTLWEDHSPEVRLMKWLGDVDATRDRQGITTAEWAGLLETFGQLGRTRGWLGEDGQQELQALLRTRLGSAGDAAPGAPAAPPAAAASKALPAARGGPDAWTTWAGPGSGKAWAGQKYGPGGLEYGAPVAGVRVVGRA